MVCLRDVTFSYSARDGQPGEAVLDRVSTEFEQGKVSVIVGPSGCGKTTLLNLIAGLLVPSSGTIENTVTKEEPGVGYVFQTPSLIPWRTVRRNAAYGAEIRGRNRAEIEHRCAELMLAHGLGRFQSAYPATLSGGMQQRVSIIRAVLSGAKTILLDEPFSNSDFVMRRALQKEVSRFTADESLIAILVTHDLEEAIRIADKVIVLGDRPAHVRAVMHIPMPRDERLNASAKVLQEMADHVTRLEEMFLPPVAETVFH